MLKRTSIKQNDRRIRKKHVVDQCTLWFVFILRRNISRQKTIGFNSTFSQSNISLDILGQSHYVDLKTWNLISTMQNSQSERSVFLRVPYEHSP